MFMINVRQKRYGINIFSFSYFVFHLPSNFLSVPQHSLVFLHVAAALTLKNTGLDCSLLYDNMACLNCWIILL